MSRLQTEDRDLYLRVARATPEGRRWLARRSTRFLSIEYLDRDLWPCQVTWDRRLDRISKGGLIAPRGHGKTETLRTKILKGFLFDRNRRVIWCSKAEQGAKRIGLSLREDLDNPGIISDFGHFRTRGARRKPWRDDNFFVGRTLRSADPSWRAVGIGSAITGHHCDDLVLDDIVDFLTVRNPDIRRKTRDYVNQTLIPLVAPGGRVWVLGTRYHSLDFYDTTIKDPQFRMDVEKALIRFPDAYEFVELDEPELDLAGNWVYFKVVIDPKGHPGSALLDSEWPVWRLLLAWKRDPVAFALQYQGEAVDEATALIKREHLETAKDSKLSYNDNSNLARYILRIQGVDPAIVTSRRKAEARDTDYFVCITFGIDKRHHRYLIGLSRDRGLDPVQQRKRLVAQAQFYDVDQQFIETNAYGEILAWRMKRETGVPIAEHHTGGQKYDPYQGYPALGTLFANEQIHLPYRTAQDRRMTDELIEELYNPDETGHDDRLSATWITESGTRRRLNVLAKMEQRRIGLAGKKSGVKAAGRTPRASRRARRRSSK